MIDRGQVFVRAINRHGKWDSVDALDLDDESFRRFILEVLCRGGLVVNLVWDQDKDQRPLYER